MSELYNIEAEQSVLGSILLDKDIMEKVTDILKEKDFYKEAHRVIYKSMLNLYENQSEIDLITLANELKTQGYLKEIGGIGYITSLSTIVPTTDNVKYYANIVKSNSQKRTLWLKAHTVTKDLERGESIDYTMSKFEADTQSLTSDENGGAENINIILQEVFNNIEQIQLGKLEEKIKTGISIIDKHTGGFGKGQLITIGAPSGQGKSSLALQIIKNICLEKNKKQSKILYVTREMTKEEVTQRLVLSYCNIGNEKLVKDGLSSEDYKNIINAMKLFSKSNLYIDQSSATIFDIQKQVRKVKPDILVIDYLQLLQPTDNKLPRERQVAELSRALKNMTIDLNITVIQLTQLAEKGTGTGDYRPHGESFTRESRAIYMDSNIVIYLWEVNGDRNLEEAIKRSERIKELATPYEGAKPEVDTLKEKIQNFNDSGCTFVEVIVDKNRTGTKGSQYYLFEGKTMNYFPIG